MTLQNKTKLVLDRLAESLVSSLSILIENRNSKYTYLIESLGAVGGYSGRQSLAFCVKLNGKDVLQFGIGNAPLAFDNNRIAIAFDGDSALDGDAIDAPLALLDWDRSNIKDEIALRNALWRKANMLFDKLLVLDGRAPADSPFAVYTFDKHSKGRPFVQVWQLNKAGIKTARLIHAACSVA